MRPGGLPLPDHDAFDPEQAALWVWRAVAALVVIAATCIVAPRDKHYQQHVKAMAAPEIGASGSSSSSSSSGSSSVDRLADPLADSSLAHSLGEWAASQEQAWVQPTDPAGAGPAAQEESELPAALSPGTAATPAASPSPTSSGGSAAEDDAAVESLQSQLVRSKSSSVCSRVSVRILTATVQLCRSIGGC